jgi:hypothetical protein
MSEPDGIQNYTERQLSEQLTESTDKFISTPIYVPTYVSLPIEDPYVLRAFLITIQA